MTLMLSASAVLAGCNLMLGIPPKEASKNLGINLFASQLDWCEDRLFADMMKSAREWTEAGHLGGGAKVAVDENGWPLADAEICFWHGIDRMNGVYHLEGSCDTEPSITIESSPGGKKISNFNYQDGRFSAKLVYSAQAGGGLTLTFRNTGGTLRDVKLMRPLTPGSEKSYPTTALFTDQAKNLVKDFNVVRFLWPVDCWNGPWQQSWSDRVQPDYCSFNRGANETSYIGWAGKGMPWEYAIRFCNETDKDMWLVLPVGADDDYIRQLANLVRDTYTVPNGKIYWEYTNEATWNGGTLQHHMQDLAALEAAVNDVIDYDGETDTNVLTARYYAKRALEMSAIWREVWGDSDMMTRVRPVLSGQLGYDCQCTWGLAFLHNYYNNGDGGYVPEPHPVNYYFYGCGGSHYTGDDPDAVREGYSEIEKFEAHEEEEACIARMYGLKRCAYEGGVWTDANDYDLPRIEDAMVLYHQLWDKYDGDVLTYYVTTGGEENGRALGFTLDSFNLDTPKFNALNQICDTSKAEMTAGPTVPCRIEGADWSVTSVPWEHPAPAGKESFGHAQLQKPWHTYRGYLFRTRTNRTIGITLEYQNVTDAYMEIMVDGIIIAKESLSGTRSPRYTVSLSKGLHAIRLKKLNTEGSLFLETIILD